MTDTEQPTPYEVAAKYFKDAPWWVKNMVDEILDAYDGAQEWEYGYENFGNDGRSLGMVPTSRDPEVNWMEHLKNPQRRLKSVGAGDWEPYTGEVVIALDPKPWHKPGTGMEEYPQNFRSEHTKDDWEFAPRKGYEQDIDKYNFRYAKCGRTDTHWPHSSLDGTGYCNGVLQ